MARSVARPLGTLEDAAAAIAHGDLGRRSGLGERTDEVGSLGRSFDTLAASLEGADEARRRFLQDVVHELKTPLAVIDATTSAVLDGVYAHDDRHLETIRGQARQLSRIVDDLRTIGLAESGVLPLHVARVSLAPLLSEIASAFGAAAAAAGGSIELTVPGDLMVQADPDRLRQAVAALVDNAIRHAPGTPIVVGATARTGGVRIEVRTGDRGSRLRTSRTCSNASTRPTNPATGLPARADSGSPSSRRSPTRTGRRWAPRMARPAERASGSTFPGRRPEGPDGAETPGRNPERAGASVTVARGHGSARPAVSGPGRCCREGSRARRA